MNNAKGPAIGRRAHQTRRSGADGGGGFDPRQIRNAQRFFASDAVRGVDRFPRGGVQVTAARAIVRARPSGIRCKTRAVRLGEGGKTPARERSRASVLSAFRPLRGTRTSRRTGTPGRASCATSGRTSSWKQRPNDGGKGDSGSVRGGRSARQDGPRGFYTLSPRAGGQPIARAAVNIGRLLGESDPTPLTASQRRRRWAFRIGVDSNPPPRPRPLPTSWCAGARWRGLWRCSSDFSGRRNTPP